MPSKATRTNGVNCLANGGTSEDPRDPSLPGPHRRTDGGRRDTDLVIHSKWRFAKNQFVRSTKLTNDTQSKLL